MSRASERATAPTRERLMDAAFELIREGGYAGASVGAIAERAGLSAGALYRHFPSKVDLVCALFQRVADQQLGLMRHAGDEAGGWLDRLDAVLRTYAQQSLAERTLSWALVYEPVDPLLDAERLAARRRYKDELADLISRAIEAGELPEQDPAVAADAVVGALAEALLNPVSPGGSTIDDEILVESVISICRRALGAEREAG